MRQRWLQRGSSLPPPSPLGLLPPPRGWKSETQSRVPPRGAGGSQQFFRRLYSSRLLRSPAQVRLFRRHLRRSSLKSAWCMGR